jgi:adenosylcobyric acid synthase
MLGRAVRDPHGVESGGDEAGLGLLPVTTVLASEKITRRVRARWRPGRRDFEGYEIHMGATTREGARPLLEVDGRAEGCVSSDGRVWGTYLHGLFEEGAPRRHVLQWARGGAALAATSSSADVAIDDRARREAAYDRLADTLAGCLDARVLREIGIA